MKIDLELYLNQSDSVQWFAKITELLGDAEDLGFQDIKIKPEGYSAMRYGVEWHPAPPLTDEEHEKLLKERGQYKDSKNDK